MRRLAAVFAALAVTFAVLAPAWVATMQTANAAPASVGHVYTVGDGVSLSAVACWAAGRCLAVGATPETGAVVPVTGGVPGAPVLVPGVAVFNAVACTSSRCEAVGATMPEGGQAAIVPVVQGRLGKITTISQSPEMTGVACSTANQCLAVGDGLTEPFHCSGGKCAGPANNPGVLTTIVAGQVHRTITVAGTGNFTAVACWDSSHCVALAVDRQAQPLVVDITDGHVGSLAEVKHYNPPGGGAVIADSLESISCQASGRCAVVGTAFDNFYSLGPDFPTIIAVADGRAGLPTWPYYHTLTTRTPTVAAVGCPSQGPCLVVGEGQGGQGAVMAATPSTLGPERTVPGTELFTGVACPSGAGCVVVGSSGTPSVPGVVVSVAL